jgi:HD-GYP domain-containing protein (c-di-GMP phosphodiesterase class II)
MSTQQISLRGLDAPHDTNSWESTERLRVGRLATCEVALDDTSVSRVHAEVLDDRRGWVVRDLGSTNGTFLNGTRVGRDEAFIREGDILQFGEVCLVVASLRWASSCGLERQRGWQVLPGGRGTLDDQLRHLLRPQSETAAAAERLTHLLQVGRACNAAKTFEGYLDAVLWELAESLNAPHAALSLLDERTGALDVRVALNVGGPPVETWAERWMGREALNRKQSLLLLHEGETEGINAILCALLQARGRPLGVLFLARSADLAPFCEDDLRLAAALALAMAPSLDSMAHLFRRQEELFLQTLTTLTEMLNLRTNRTDGHPQRVTDYSLLLAEELSLSRDHVHHLRVGGPLHDLGTTGVRDAILHKPGPLSPEEIEEVRGHFTRGAALLEAVPSFVPLIPIVRSHREYWDGSGYPDGLAGAQIPLLGRVVAVADAFDAMTTDRPYRKALPLQEAFAEIERRSGTQFDPACVSALLRLRPRIEDYYLQRHLSTQTIPKDALEAIRQTLGLVKKPGRSGGGRTTDAIKVLRLS